MDYIHKSAFRLDGTLHEKGISVGSYMGVPMEISAGGTPPNNRKQSTAEGSRDGIRDDCDVPLLGHTSAPRIPSRAGQWSYQLPCCSS
jgi:hypothetical protein